MTIRNLLKNPLQKVVMGQDQSGDSWKWEGSGYILEPETTGLGERLCTVSERIDFKED